MNEIKAPTRRRRSPGSSPYAPPKSRASGAPRRRRRETPSPRLLSQLDSASTAALVLGVASLVCALAAPFAIWQGSVAQRLARQARVPTPGGATAGLVIGWIVCGLTVLVIGVWILLLASLVVVS
ncbi:MAG: DUF4190 domain-containing protein [Planctomycetes bacterium]|nr:DUF4190 domain-containing protein [Planctomycetota bacterium]